MLSIFSFTSTSELFFFLNIIHTEKTFIYLVKFDILLTCLFFNCKIFYHL